MSGPILVVGASLAGISTVDALRMRGCSRPIILLGDEPHDPYDRPPLSKGFLSAEKSPEVTSLRDRSRLAELDVDLRLGVAATGVDLARKVVHSTDGDIGYDDLVIATGADARAHPVATDLDGFSVLRTVDDARRIRAALDEAHDVVVLGAGFIGAEVAAAARARGLIVTMVERLETPMSTALGDDVGSLLARMHTEQGVDIRCGTTVTAAQGDGRVEKVVLSDGSSIAADLVVVGLGVTPNIEWLAESGLSLGDGVLCDKSLRAIGQEHVYAAGDVARWDHPLFGESLRIEHWTNATEHADVVASQLIGPSKAADAVPYVWSDQYGHRIQVVGCPRLADGITVRKDSTGHSHIAVYERDRLVIGVFAIDSPRGVVKGRRAIASGMPATEFLATL
jgi:NADPH-dependent 2,4-dienoyl-CoA reductase/sulfur reductase-like enzyme